MCSPSSCFSSPISFFRSCSDIRHYISLLSPLFHFPPFQVPSSSFIPLFFFLCLDGSLLSSFVEFSALLWCLLFLICLFIAFSVPKQLSSVSRSLIFPLFPGFSPFSCALYFSLTSWGQNSQMAIGWFQYQTPSISPPIRQDISFFPALFFGMLGLWR